MTRRGESTIFRYGSIFEPTIRTTEYMIMLLFNLMIHV